MKIALIVKERSSEEKIQGSANAKVVPNFDFSVNKLTAHLANNPLTNIVRSFFEQHVKIQEE